MNLFRSKTRNKLSQFHHIKRKQKRKRKKKNIEITRFKCTEKMQGKLKHFNHYLIFVSKKEKVIQREFKE